MAELALAQGLAEPKRKPVPVMKKSQPIHLAEPSATKDAAPLHLSSSATNVKPTAEVPPAANAEEQVPHKTVEQISKSDDVETRVQSKEEANFEAEVERRLAEAMARFNVDPPQSQPESSLSQQWLERH